jgi:hypothetical protein
MDALLAQESAERKYLILKDPTIAELFWSRSQEFKCRYREFEKKIIYRISLKPCRNCHHCITDMMIFLIRQMR